MGPRELRAAAGRMIVAGFEGDALPAHVARAVRETQLGGVILFARNVDTPAQVQSLCADVHAAGAQSGRVPIVSIDQEGGRVQRVREPATRIPPMLTVGQAGDADLAAKLGEMVGDELDALGFNVNFAPVADVFTNPDNTVIGDRAFGRDPVTAARFAGSFMLGLTMAGVVPCIKHFPGHGDTRVDSHEDLPVVEHDLERLRAVELKPFERLIAARAPMVMTAHLLVPAIDPELPITFSPRGVGELLRQQLGFGGVVVSDDLEMGAVAKRYGIEEMMHLGVDAGLDVFLICHTREKWEEAFEVLVRIAERGGKPAERIALSAGRLAALEKSWLRPWEKPASLGDRLGTDEHRALVDAIVKRAERFA